MDNDLKDALKISAQSMAAEAMQKHIATHVKNERVAGFLSAVAGDAIMGNKPRASKVLGLALTALLSKKGSW